jgi:hypothetical protein
MIELIAIVFGLLPLFHHSYLKYFYNPPLLFTNLNKRVSLQFYAQFTASGSPDRDKR